MLKIFYSYKEPYRILLSKKKMTEGSGFMFSTKAMNGSSFVRIHEMATVTMLILQRFDLKTRLW